MSRSASAFCITHTSAPGHLTYLAPFAVCQAFPGPDHYGASVALGVAPFRQSRVPLVADVQDGLGASFVSFRPLQAVLSPRCVCPPKRSDSACQEPRASSRMPWLTDGKSDTEVQAV